VAKILLLYVKPAPALHIPLNFQAARKSNTDLLPTSRGRECRKNLEEHQVATVCISGQHIGVNRAFLNDQEVN